MWLRNRNVLCVPGNIYWLVDWALMSLNENCVICEDLDLDWIVFVAFFWPLVTEVFRCLFAFQEFCICQFPFVWNSVVICIDLVMERFNWVGQSSGITKSCQFSQTAQFSPRIYQPCLSHQCVLTKSKIGTQNLSTKTLPTRKCVDQIQQSLDWIHIDVS